MDIDITSRTTQYQAVGEARRLVVGVSAMTSRPLGPRAIFTAIWRMANADAHSLWQQGEGRVGRVEGVRDAAADLGTRTAAEQRVHMGTPPSL